VKHSSLEVQFAHNKSTQFFQPSGFTSARSTANRRQGYSTILAHVERFLAIQVASGIVLMIAAVAALVLANSPWRNFYTDLWHIPIGFHYGAISLRLGSTLFEE
jgi:NhaA family Na+:H+ antiporter